MDDDEYDDDEFDSVEFAVEQDEQEAKERKLRDEIDEALDDFHEGRPKHEPLESESETYSNRDTNFDNKRWAKRFLDDMKDDDQYVWYDHGSFMSMSHSYLIDRNY